MADITTDLTDVLKEISFLGRRAGRLKLASCFNMHLEKEDDKKTALLLDFYYDSLMFCVTKAFSWKGCANILTFMSVMLDEAKGKGLPEAIRIYQSLFTKTAVQLKEKEQKIFTDYFFSTYMQHFKLFQYMLLMDQEKVTIDVDCDISTPPAPMPFTESKDIKLWDYEQQLQNIQELHDRKKLIRDMEMESMDEKLIQQKEKILDDMQTLQEETDRQRLTEIIREVVSSHITAATNTLKHNIDDVSENLSFMLEKTSVPRPSELDEDLRSTTSQSSLAPLPNFKTDTRPPPRHQTKTLLGTSTKAKTRSGKERTVSSTSKLGRK